MIQTHLSKPRLVFDHFSNFFHHKPLLIDKKDTFNLFCVLKQSYNSHNWINPARFTRTVKCFSFVILLELEKFNLDGSPIEGKWFFGFSLMSFRLISILSLNFLVKVLLIEKEEGKTFLGNNSFSTVELANSITLPCGWSSIPQARRWSSLQQQQWTSIPAARRWPNIPSGQQWSKIPAAQQWSCKPASRQRRLSDWCRHPFLFF